MLYLLVVVPLMFAVSYGVKKAMFSANDAIARESELARRNSPRSSKP